MDDQLDQLRDDLRITCADAIDRMTDLLEASLSRGDRERMDDHLAGCQACAVYLDQLRRTVTIVGSIRQADAYAVSDSTMQSLIEVYRARPT